MRFKPHTAFPVLLLQPLGHLSNMTRGSLAEPAQREKPAHCPLIVNMMYPGFGAVPPRLACGKKSVKWPSVPGGTA